MPDSDKHLPSLGALQRKIDDADTGPNGVKKGGSGSDRASGEGMAKAMGMAWSMVSGATVGIIGGYLLDGWLNTSPIFIITGFFLGFAAGLYALMRQIGQDETPAK